jgi:hypothetical protein
MFAVCFFLISCFCPNSLAIGGSSGVNKNKKVSTKLIKALCRRNTAPRRFYPSPFAARRASHFLYPINVLVDSPNCNFVSFLQHHFSKEQINTIFENYLLGATKNKEVIFWQMDIQDKVCTGKIM